MKRLFCLFLMLVLAAGCEGFLKPEIIDVEDFEIEGLTLNNFPFIDCSTSTSPLRDMVMFNLLGVGYRWGIDVVTGSQYAVSFIIPEGMELHSDEHKAFADRMLQLRKASGSHEAYINLIDGTTGVIIDSRDISRNEKDYADQKRVKIETKPLAWDALVCIVHPSNKIKSLTQEQIRMIYTGKITNWKEVGGEDLEIHAYTRNVDSGSQEKMETLVMDGLKMIDNPKYMGGAMLSPYFSIEQDSCGIGYTPYYFCESMVRDLHAVKVIGVDGAQPTSKTIMKAVKGEEGGYPYFSHIYAAIRADEPADSFARQIYTWLSTPKAKDIIDESGYLSMRK
jgi:phosphate transport system substrate-binding protein